MRAGSRAVVGENAAPHERIRPMGGHRVSRSGAGYWLAGAIALLFTAIALKYAFDYHFNAVDDAFISFRYARNLANGNGLVFNPGERVEGYTNFLWTVVL